VYRHYSNKFEREIVIIHPGEYFASKDDLIISTVLGSCVAVAFYDRSSGIGGLNHFMLAGDNNSGSIMSETGRYGMHAMELVINAMLKLGARRNSLRAKVFGGAHVLRTSPDGEATIPRSNVAFAMNYLETENIEIESSDVGGTTGRKILFFPASTRVLLKRITGTLITDVEREEKQYLEQIKKPKKPAGDEVTLF